MDLHLLNRNSNIYFDQNDDFELTKSQRKKLRKTRQKNLVRNNLELEEITPKTKKQVDAFTSYYEGDHLVLHGVAGTGKTFIAMFLALSDISRNIEDKTNLFIIRSAVPSRNIGFLPGNIKEKAKIYELPYQEICSELYNRKDAYELLKQKGTVDFMTTSFFRGLTLRNAIVIVDEIQNLTSAEFSTIMTRIGENCRLIVCGDIKQTDLDRREKIEVKNNLEILKRMKSTRFIEFDYDDICRSDFVKDFLITKDRYESML